jgi:hypothetical protein
VRPPIVTIFEYVRGKTARTSRRVDSPSACGTLSERDETVVDARELRAQLANERQGRSARPGDATIDGNSASDGYSIGPIRRPVGNLESESRRVVADRTTTRTWSTSGDHSTVRSAGVYRVAATLSK